MCRAAVFNSDLCDRGYADPVSVAVCDFKAIKVQSSPRNFALQFAEFQRVRSLLCVCEFLRDNVSNELPSVGVLYEVFCCQITRSLATQVRVERIDHRDHEKQAQKFSFESIHTINTRAPGR